MSDYLHGMNHKRLSLVTLLLVLFTDQALKIWVKTNMAYGEEFSLLGLSFALVHFVENNGMAFGLSFGGGYGKLALTVFRLIAVAVLSLYVVKLVRIRVARRLLLGFTLVLAGAVGNIIDSVFYGVLFSESSFHGGVADFLPAEGGYAPLFYGRVVDMLYFPLFYGNYPDWMPFIGGDVFLFFRPVFNLADVAIALGGILLLLWFFGNGKQTAEIPAEDGPAEAA